MLFTIKRLDLNVKIVQKIKIILKLKTKIINEKETKTSTFFFNIVREIVLILPSHHKI